MELNKHRTLVFPFVFTNGATSRNNQALGQNGELRRLFDGKNSVLVRWLNSRQPLVLADADGTKKAKINFQDGVAFEGFNYGYDLFNQFVKDTVTETIELMNYKTLKLTLNLQQINNWFGTNFAQFFSDEDIPLAPAVDDTWLSILYYIPELSDRDLFFIENAVLFKDNKGTITLAEVSLRSLTTELRQSGRAFEQWVNFAAPGDQYVLPALDATKPKKFIRKVKNNPGAVYVQLETDDIYALNSFSLFGRPVNADMSVLETPRLLFFANTVNPIFNTIRKTLYNVTRYTIVKGQFLNDFFYADPKPNFLAELEALYNPVQKRETSAYFAVTATAKRKQYIDNYGIEAAGRQDGWLKWKRSYELDPAYQQPVRFYTSQLSRENFKVKNLPDNKKAPDVRSLMTIKNEIEFLTLNTISYFDNNHFEIGTKVYSQDALGAFSNLLTTAATGLSAVIGGFVGAKLGSPITGAAIGGFIGQALGKFLGVGIKAWTRSTLVENADDFEWSFLVPAVIVEKMKKMFTTSNRLPLPLFMGDKNFMTALGFGKLPTVLTFQITDTFVNDKTSLDAISKTNNFDIKDVYQTKAVLKSFAIDVWRILGLGMVNFRVSFFDRQKNLIYTTYQQSQSKWSENILDAATESAVSDYEAMSTGFPPGYDNILEPKTVPDGFLPTFLRNTALDVDLAFPVRNGFQSVRSPVIIPPTNLTALGNSNPYSYQAKLELVSSSKLSAFFAAVPKYRIKISFEIVVSGSTVEDPKKVALPIINGMRYRVDYTIDANTWIRITALSNVGKPFIFNNGHTFSTLQGFPAEQIMYTVGTADSDVRTIGYAQGVMGLKWKEKIFYNDTTQQLVITIYDFQTIHAAQTGDGIFNVWALSLLNGTAIGAFNCPFHITVIPNLSVDEAP